MFRFAEQPTQARMKLEIELFFQFQQFAVLFNIPAVWAKFYWYCCKDIEMDDMQVGLYQIFSEKLFDWMRDEEKLS